MAFDPDRFYDRRRLKLSVAFWRTLAVFAIVLLAVVAVARFGFDGVRGERIVRLWLNDVIVDDPDREAALIDLAEDARTRAVIVRIDSPGGTAAGGEALYLALRRIAAHKPVVAVMGTTATSAAYMAALGADYILAREASVTGSIGVILQTAEITVLLADLGVRTEAIKSAPLKAQPSPLEPLTEEARQAAQAVIDDMYQLFIGLVAERRHLPAAEVRLLADGRVFTGRQARAAGLIGALGGEQEARDWLAATHAVDADLPAADLDRPEAELPLFEALGRRLRAGLIPARLRLDGVISLWQGELGK